MHFTGFYFYIDLRIYDIFDLWLHKPYWDGTLYAKSKWNTRMSLTPQHIRWQLERSLV